MSDNDTNDQRQTGPVEPASGGNVPSGHGWRPPVAGPPRPVDESHDGTGDTPAAASGDAGSRDAGLGDAPSSAQASGTPGGSVAPQDPEPSDETTTPQPYGGGSSPGTGDAKGAEPTSGEAPGPVAAGWPAGGYQSSAQPGYQPGSYPVGGYPTSQYQQPGYPQPGQQPGGPPTTGAGYQGGYQGSGYPGGYLQQPPGHRGGVRRKVAAGVLGVALAVGGGIAGAAWMHELDGNNATPAASAGAGGAPDNAPIIDRSSLASIAAAVRPSVVSITTSNATGSGVIISADGYILTNNHVAAAANGGNVQITLSDGSTVRGKLIGTDPKTDLAVFQAQNASKLTPAKFGNSSALRVGDTVLAIGSPLGLDGSVTAGIVSALNRTINESSNSQPDPFGQQSQNSSPGATIAGAIQTDAPINPGNSGGALVNTNGEVVGINTAIATNGSDGNIGVGFAIPSNRAKDVADDLIKGVAVQHPFLGVSVATADGNAGAQVQQVQPGSPAASAGLRAGDLITAYNNKPVRTSDDLVNDVQSGKVNDEVTVTVQRGGSTSQVKVTLGESK